jgi:predicted flap endonuclease-1-like 5' DNA nuclease
VDQGVQDDLRQVVGIGPVIHKVLVGAGITTYRQLAELADDGQALARAATALGGDVRARIERQRWLEQARELHFQKYGERL